MTYLTACFCDLAIKVLVKTCICFNLEFSYDFEDSLEMKEKATVQLLACLVPRSTYVLVCPPHPPHPLWNFLVT